MKTAFTYWKHRIAPVFDTAHRILLIEQVSEQIVHRRRENLTEYLPLQKALQLVAIGVDTLVCGAISRPVHEIIAAYGIQVIGFVAGDLEKVVQAWHNSQLKDHTFAMPGCHGKGCHQGRKMHGDTRRETKMSGKGYGGRGGRQGQGGQGQTGQGQGGKGSGRRANPTPGSNAGTCVCPKCGHQESHERGIPCYQKQCPTCGTGMTRQ
jgi:predicted Fe-Mo cluster-binding NifX family protein